MSALRVAGEPVEVVAALRGWLVAADAPELIVETSGSTGVPKRVVLSREAVLASVQATARRLGGEGRWALALPPTYVAGLQVIVRSLVAGEEPVLDSWGEAAYTSLVPTHLHRLLDSPPDVDALSGMKAVLVGGGPIDASLRQRAEAAGIRMVATYGSAETAGGCVYDGWPLDGVGVALGADGRIRISGPTLFERYDGDPAGTEAARVGGWFHTADAGRFDEDGRLHVLGRLDDVVVSGGVNVPTPAVAARLREHHAVTDAAVVGVPDPEWGNRVVAFVVSTDRNDVAGLRDWVAEVHPRAWAPREVVTVDELPLLGNGKVDRVALQRRAEAGG